MSNCNSNYNKHILQLHIIHALKHYVKTVEHALRIDGWKLSAFVLKVLKENFAKQIFDRLQPLQLLQLLQLKLQLLQLQQLKLQLQRFPMVSLKFTNSINM